MWGTLRRKYLLFNWFHFLSILGRKYILQGQIFTGITSLWNVIFTFLLMHKNVPVILKFPPLIIKNQHSTDTRVVWLKNKQNHCNLQLFMTKKGQRVHTSPPISFNVILRENESKCSSWWFSINQCCEHVNNYRGLKPDGKSSICFKESFTCNKVSCLSRSSEAFDPALACRLQCPKLICNLDSIIGLLSLIRAQLSPSLKTNVKHFEER